jgi:hypothetical protein
VGLYAAPDSEQEQMCEISSVAPLHVNFGDRYLTRPEFGRGDAALARKPNPSVSTICYFDRGSGVSAKNFWYRNNTYSC